MANWIRTYPTTSTTKPFASYVETTGQAVGSAFKGGEETGALTAEQARTFYQALTAELKKANSSISGITCTDVTVPAATADSTTRTVSVQNAGMGAYLFTFAGGTDVYEPSVVLVYPTQGTDGTYTLAENTPLTIKSEPVTIKKTASTHQVGVNEKVTFTLDNIVVPTYPADAVDTTFNVYDTLPEGIEFVNPMRISVTSGSPEADPSTYTALTANTDYSYQNSGAQDLSTPANNVDLAVVFDYSKLTPGNAIVISYDVVVTADATAGTPMTNQVKITYSNNPYTQGKYTDKPDEETLFTYRLKVIKTGSDDAALAGAEFTLTRDGGTEALTFTRTATAACPYKVAATGAQNTTTTLVSGDDGTICVDGLDAGTYQLKETKAPADYVLLKDPIVVTITDGDEASTESTGQPDGIIDDVTFEQDATAADKATFTQQVKNTKGFDLPITGAQGIALLVGGGILLLAPS